MRTTHVCYRKYFKDKKYSTHVIFVFYWIKMIDHSQADRKGVGSPPLALTVIKCENFDPYDQPDRKIASFLRLPLHTHQKRMFNIILLIFSQYLRNGRYVTTSRAIELASQNTTKVMEDVR